MKKDILTTGQPLDPDQLYCDVSDVQRYIRSFEFTNNSNPNKDQVKEFIKSRTRFIEQNIVTGFRKLELKDKELKVNLSEKQQRHNLKRRSLHNNKNNYPSSNITNDRYTKVNLPHFQIDEIEEIELISQAGYNKADDYQIDKRDGILRLNHREFKPSRSENYTGQIYRDTRVKVSYTYGLDSVSDNIKDACAKLVAYDIINSDEFGEVRADVENLVSTEEYTKRIKEEALEVINKYK